MCPLCPHLGVEAWVLTDITDVNRKARGSHQLSDAVIDQPVGTRQLLHADVAQKAAKTQSDLGI